jgi:hypothetical protein
MERKELFKKIEDMRKSKVIAYVTSDRQGPVNGTVAMDIIPIVSHQLRRIGKTDKIDLVLYSSGGDTMVPWRLVSMIREYCSHFSVIVPYKAHSAATMIALGADEIVMSDMSELSPIDPSVANFFNPVDPQNPQVRVPISVEDVMSYFDLAKNKFGIAGDENLAKIFSTFTESNPSIHPLALGNVNRAYNLIQILATRLLKSHKKPLATEDIERVVAFLTKGLYSHQYLIGRKEATEDIGIKTVVCADAELSTVMTDLYESYVTETNMKNGWNPEFEIGINEQTKKKEYKVAFVESAVMQNYYATVYEFKRVQQNMPQQTPQGMINVMQEQIMVRLAEQGWK